MSKSLWMFIGSVPEDGDCCLVWASDAVEAMSEGRRLSGYAPDDDPDCVDEDFEVHPATAVDIIGWSPALINRTTLKNYDESVLDTDSTRKALEAELRAIQSMYGCAERNEPAAA